MLSLSAFNQRVCNIATGSNHKVYTQRWWCVYIVAPASKHHAQGPCYGCNGCFSTHQICWGTQVLVTKLLYSWHYFCTKDFRSGENFSFSIHGFKFLPPSLLTPRVLKPSNNNTNLMIDCLSMNQLKSNSKALPKYFPKKLRTSRILIFFFVLHSCK